MAEKRDYYEVLGISKTSTQDEIKKAYRALARKYHPDLHPDDKECEEKFKEATEAYEVLSDPSKKERYDQFGHAGVDPSYGGGGFNGGFNGGFSGGGFSDMGDIFENIFGGMFGGSTRTSNVNAPRRGQDITQSVVIDFMEACKGVKKEIKLTRMESCHDCGGTGAAPGTSPEVCPECHGTGTVNIAQRTAFGTITSRRSCTRCGGKGKIVKTPCQKCRGIGRIRASKILNVDIPAGIDDGQTIRIGGQGDAGANGGPSGNVNVNVSVRPDPIFKRDGFNLYCEVPITYTQAVLGDDITVPTIDGSVKYSISEGTQNGARFRLKGKGVKRLNRSDRGDQYVTVNVEIPKNLTKKQKDLLKEFESSLESNNYQKRQGFFDKLKEKFSGN